MGSWVMYMSARLYFKTAPYRTDDRSCFLTHPLSFSDCPLETHLWGKSQTFWKRRWQQGHTRWGSRSAWDEPSHPQSSWQTWRREPLKQHGKQQTFISWIFFTWYHTQAHAHTHTQSTRKQHFKRCNLQKSWDMQQSHLCHIKICFSHSTKNYQKKHIPDKNILKQRLLTLL